MEQEFHSFTLQAPGMCLPVCCRALRLLSSVLADLSRDTSFAILLIEIPQVEQTNPEICYWNFTDLRNRPPVLFCTCRYRILMRSLNSCANYIRPGSYLPTSRCHVCVNPLNPKLWIDEPENEVFQADAPDTVCSQNPRHTEPAYLKAAYLNPAVCNSNYPVELVMSRWQLCAFREPRV